MDKTDEKMNDEYISNGAYEQYSHEYMDRLFGRMMDKYKFNSQMFKTQEEAGELVRAIARYFISSEANGGAPSQEALDNLIEELIDVHIMVSQLMKVLPQEELAIKFYEKLDKMDRLVGGA